MAIKTKKISELDTLKDINGTYAVVGVGDGTTGKITLEQIKNFVDAHKAKTVEQVSEVSKQDLKAVSSEAKKVADEVAAVKKSSDEFVTKYTNMVYTQTQKNGVYESEISKLNTFNEELVELVSSLETRVKSLESFVQALQKDGYLTLKEIQRAAADACPICNHHHEEQSAK